MLDNITETEIQNLNGLERISYLLYEFNVNYLLYDMIDDVYHKKQYVIDFFHRIAQELKNLENVSVLLETYPTLDELKVTIEESIQNTKSLYYDYENFNFADEQINEMKKLLNTLLDAVYTEIGNRMCEEN